MAGRRTQKGSGNGNYRAKVKELIEDLEYALEYPKKPGILLIGPANYIWWESRDKLHEMGADNLPEVKKIDRKIVKEVATWGGVWYDREDEFRASKPLSYWWWWLDKIMDGELSKDLLPEHVRDLIS